MGSTFCSSWTSIGKVKTALRTELFGDTPILAEASGRVGKETVWYVAAALREPYAGLPVGAVVASVILLYPPEGGYGAGYKDLSEFEGPYAVNGVTAAFLSTLTPLPPAKSGPSALTWAHSWRAKAAAEAERTFMAEVS